MRRQDISKKILVFILAVIMFLPMSAVTADAAVGDLINVDTGLNGDIDLNDTISLPIKLLDYEADGMLFEYAESKEVQSASDFGAKYAYDFTGLTGTSTPNNSLTSTSFVDYWSCITSTVMTGTYANYGRITWKANKSDSDNIKWTNGKASVLLTDFKTNVNMDDIRYVVIVYRTNVEDAMRLSINNGSGAKKEGCQSTFALSIKGATGDGSTTNWTYDIFDLKTGGKGNSQLEQNCPNELRIADSEWTTTSGIYASLPLDASGEYMDVAHVAYFSNKTQAEKFGEYALTDGSDRGDNRAFGLLRGSRTQATDTTLWYDGVADVVDSVKQVNTYGDSKTAIEYSSIEGLGYTLLGTFEHNGIANIGLLESSLGADGYPVYKEEVVSYVAGLLEASLSIPERTSDGWKNYKYIRGTASARYGGVDLATALRNQITGGLGSYEDSKNKELIGTWETVGKNIKTYHDAAYFLLNNIFRDGFYNEVQDNYDYLVLSAGEDAELGKKAYGFDGGFTTSSDTSQARSAVNYDKTKRTIQNSSAAGKTHFYFEGNTATTLNPFLPITDKNNSAGQTISTNYQDDGVLSTGTIKDTLVNRNYNFVMVSEGEFVYHADDELFFDFEGDDDVYLFINGELVMDIGSAHSIDGARINVNDYVNAAKAGTLGSSERNEALALEEGNVYTFKFYYMERHSYGSNIRVTTNIRVTDPAMQTTKTAWQDGNRLDYGSIIEADKIVEYGFAITNSGEQNLFHLSFDDNDIGVILNETDGLKVTNTSQVTNLDGGVLEASDLTATVEHPDYNDIIVHFNTNEDLKLFLKDLSADGTVNKEGLFIGATVTFRGIGYKLTEKQIEAGVFDNTVFTTADNGNGRTLQGQDSMRVYVPGDLMYYQWAGHDLTVTKEKLISDINNKVNPDVKLEVDSVNKIEITTKSGVAITNEHITVDEQNNTVINYSKDGSCVYYAKVTYSDNKQVVVPVVVNVVDVADSVYVLDYGLKADLTEKLIDLDKDKVVVPGRDTTYASEGITAKSPSYGENHITFLAVGNGADLTGKDGTFNWKDKTLIYTPTDFMEDVYTIYAAIRVKESNYDTENASPIGTVDINNEVEMYKSVTVLPATVVYYEDDFPAITYEGTVNTIDPDGTVTNLENAYNRVDGDDDLYQGTDQDEDYGHDNVYAVAGNTDSSAGTLTTITVKSTGQVASFNFTGTGFELISRTTAEDSACIVVTVKDKDDNVIKKIPVITEFDNLSNGAGGDEKIYQVPVIRIDDLEHGTYKVEISGVQSWDFSGEEPTKIDSYLYVDGLRIYQPLGATNENYTAEENGAVFKELHDLICDGEVAAVTVGDDGVQVSSGLHTWVENRNGDEGITGNTVNTVNDYLLYGPNNEVYLEGTYNSGPEALMFYVKETEGEVHNLQLAMRGLDEGLFLGAGSTGVNAKVEYAVANADGTITWTEVATLISSTEQYYTIDYTKCPKEDIGYKVVIRVTDPEIADQAEGVKSDAMASFTTLKYNGLEIVSKKSDGSSIFEDKATFKYYEGTLFDSNEVKEDNGSGTETSEVPNIETTNTDTNTSAVAVTAAADYAVDTLAADSVSTYGALLDSYTAGTGTFELTENSRMFVVSDTEPTGDLLQTVQLVNRQFAAKGYPSQTPLAILWGKEEQAKAGDIIIKADSQIASEGYGLNVTDRAVVTYGDTDGLLYGVNSLMKFFILDGDMTLSGFMAADAPDTKERTVMLDTGRKYYTKEWICNFIRQMSWMGYNTIELHFSEDGGFRADFWDEKYYTDSYHPENDFSWLCGSYVQSWVKDPYRKDSDIDKYLTTAELVEILQVAKEYHLDVIPSFDSPAHMDYITWKFEQHYKANENYSFTYNGTTYKASSTKGCINYTNTTGASSPTWPNYTAMDITSGTMSRAFVFALYSDIADFFKTYAGSTDFSIGGDEVNLTSYETSYPRTWTYAKFPEYINSLNRMLNAKGYTCRMFNDFIGSTAKSNNISNGKAKYDFDDNIEIMYWNSDFNPTTGEENAEKIWGAEFFWKSNNGGKNEWGDGNRVIYNCIQTNCYYVLREGTSGSNKDARNPENRIWTFYHSTEENIYNEWYPADISEHGVYSEDAADVDLDYFGGEHLGGAYFLIWNDYAALNTESEVWKDAQDTIDTPANVYSLFDRMYSNSIKMWNADVNNTVNYSAFAAVRDKISDGNDGVADYFPGYTDCSATPSLPAAASVEKALTKHTLTVYYKDKGTGKQLKYADTKSYEEGTSYELDTMEIDGYNLNSVDGADYNAETGKITGVLNADATITVWYESISTDPDPDVPVDPEPDGPTDPDSGEPDGPTDPDPEEPEDPDAPTAVSSIKSVAGTTRADRPVGILVSTTEDVKSMILQDASGSAVTPVRVTYGNGGDGSKLWLIKFYAPSQVGTYTYNVILRGGKSVQTTIDINVK